MFYSQFILAKKGPLGTIWIAAHLERKLRKNQVADTDIGDSVDSILFPDVPIALRLSSHLLLGVVRIYSRKVNYLFDDCSEALLKVKQAFRSTAVDLPPEESKAPYHSITLPETFDLDDFELPDNEIFQGNYVDHHISSREQITLQDNMEGVVYSTSQFGLDERFGDGDTSGLDLDEELSMGKVDAAGYSGVSADPQASFNSMIHVKQDEHDEGLHANVESQMDQDFGDVDIMDYAHAPSTPGLVEEPNLSNVQETSCCDEHIESEENHLTESVLKKNLENASSRLILHQGDEHVGDWSNPNYSNSDGAPGNDYHSSDMGVKIGFSPPTEDTCKHISSEDCVAASGTPFVAEAGVHHEEPILADKIIASSDGLDEEEALGDDNVKADRVDISCEDHELNGTISEGGSGDVFASANPNLDSERSPSLRYGLSTESLDASGLEKFENSHGQVKILQPCNADLGEPDPSHTGAGDAVSFEPCNIDAVQLENSKRLDVSQSTVAQDETCNSVDDSEQKLKEKHIVAPTSPADVCAGSVKLDDLGNNLAPVDSPVQNFNSSGGIEVPAPEKMLFVPEGFNDQARNLLMDSTPADMARVDESDAGSRIVSGKKRSYTESTLTEQSLNSVESSRAVRARKTVEAIPDDDDLLSSILVGRRSSVLRVKPSPLPCEITSLKHHRTALRTSTSKRKVLMDDTMVLHGDTIRQQLMNTEDIRRLRKKAPCTRPEIAMIQRQFLEDQIFRESMFSGASLYLASLHSQTYDLSGIRVSKDEVDDTSAILASEPTSTSRKDEIFMNAVIENAVNTSGQNVIVVNDRDGASVLETVRENGMQNGQTSKLNDMKLGDSELAIDVTVVPIKSIEDLAVASDPSGLQIEHLQDLTENVVGGSRSIDGAVNPTFPAKVGPSNCFSSDFGGFSSDVVRPDLLDNGSEMDEPLIASEEKRELECAEVDAPMMQGVMGKVNDNNDGVVYVGDFIRSVETGHTVKDGILLESSQADGSVEIVRAINDLVESNDYIPTDETKADLDGRGVNSRDQIHNGISGEEPMISSSNPAENSTFHYGEDLMLHKSNLGNMMQYAGISDIDIPDCDELNYSAAAIDTEFLNVDDDEVAEVTDDYIPDAEETRFTENSGWSSRTRAVAKYLQTLFVKEAEYGRKAIPMDNLLVGKTRKEASRMFFEALVLKTRDYIHVEQKCPFDNITIRPGTKLVKSDF